LEKQFFFLSLATVLVTFFISTRIRPLKLHHFIVGLISAAFSVIFDTFFGKYLGLYYYVSKESSIVYMVIAGIFIYPVINMLYVMFLPDNRNSALVYTIMLFVGMLIFEYLSIITRTLVFTGWKPIPWSIITYAFTFTWVYYLHRLLIQGKA